jgi:hypothetical protein
LNKEISIEELFYEDGSLREREVENLLKKMLVDF